MAILKANSPVDFQFQRSGGADIQAEVQIWPKKTKYSPTDRPLLRISFNNPLVAHEAASVPVAKGAYVCVFLGIIREALNGVYATTLTVEGVQVFSKKGDVNTTPGKNDFINIRADIEMVVS
jgi:hypothetical protein